MMGSSGTTDPSDGSCVTTGVHNMCSFSSGFVPGILGDSRRACCFVIVAVIVVVLGPLLVVGVINDQWG